MAKAAVRRAAVVVAILESRVSSSPFRFAVSASFTAEPIQPFIEFWGRRLNTEFEVRFAPYNQVLQTLLDPASEFGANQHGVNIVLVRLEDLGEPTRVDANANELVAVIRDSAARLGVPLIVCLCPASPESIADAQLARSSRELCPRIAGMLDDVPGVQYLSAEQIDRLYPVEARHDPDAERLGRIPYTELYFCAMGSAVVRYAHALLNPPYKVIALDCDNTLWQGICGEDGPSGVVVDPARRALQEFMLEQREAGMVLVLNSKNNEQDVLDTFAANPQMPLQLRHFVGWRLNWESKAENLSAMAAELGLGLDSFIFVDDSFKECAEMTGNLPEVLTAPLPAEIVRIPEFLKHLWAFDHPVVTEEDRNRSAYYTQAQEFGREVKRASNLDEFIAGLKLQVTFSPLSADRLSRAAQLTQRTNQFNFTTIRRTEADIRALGYDCVTIDVVDRFGSYGLVGLMIFRQTPEALVIDTFLLSCRVLGRGVEHRMLAWLGEEAGRRGLTKVIARIEITKKNKPAQQFLHAVGQDVEGLIEGGFEYVFNAERLRSIQWSRSTSVEAPKEKAKASSSSRRLVDYVVIANELATAVQIVEAMRHEAQVGESGADATTEIESKLASIWSELLKQSSISVSDNFFDLGGHSLLAVLLILRVRETFGVELPIDDVYSSTLTLGELARKIELLQVGQMNPDEYAALLAEIEALTDAEVQALLLKEESGMARF